VNRRQQRTWLNAKSAAWHRTYGSVSRIYQHGGTGKRISLADLFLVPGARVYGLPVLEAFYRRVSVVMNVASNVSEILADNPWVAISEDSKAIFLETVLQCVTNLKAQSPLPEVLSELPTESSWAREIGERSLWCSKD